MEGPFEVQHISISIRRSPNDVYAFITNGEYLSRWATGLGDKIQRVGGEWVAEGPLGKVRDGDLIRVDAIAGTLDAKVEAATWAAREQAMPSEAQLDDNRHGLGRELFGGMRRNVLSVGGGGRDIPLRRSTFDVRPSLKGALTLVLSGLLSVPHVG